MKLFVRSSEVGSGKKSKKPKTKRKMWGEVPNEHAYGDHFHNESWQNQNKTRRHNETGLCAAYVVFSLFFLWLCLTENVNQHRAVLVKCRKDKKNLSEKVKKI